MGSPVSDQSRSLGEVLAAYVALVRSDLGVAEHVLVKVALRWKVLVAEGADDTRAVLGLVIHELARPGESLAALVAAVLLHVPHEVVFELRLAPELSHAEPAVEKLLFLRVHQLLLVVPLVGLDVLDVFSAESAHLALAQVYELDVEQQVLLKLVRLTTVVTAVLGLNV